MCVFTSIFAALGTTLGSIGASMAGAATAGSIAVGGGLISAGAAIGTSAVALGTATSIGLGVGAVGLIGKGLKDLMDKKTESLSVGVTQQSPTSLSDTVSKSADKMVDTNRKSNPLSSLRIKQTMNNKQETGMNIANDSGTGLNLGG